MVKSALKEEIDLLNINFQGYHWCLGIHGESVITDNSKKFIFVSIFGEQPGHSVKDIAFYFDALLHWEVEFEYYMPEFSMRQLREGVEFARHIEVHDDGSWRDAFKIASQVLVKNSSVQQLRPQK